MLAWLKKKFYFLVAGYFAFWAKILLQRWRPTIVTVTGSSGKTTLFKLLEAQLADKAIFSHESNSVFGLPFHVLGLKRVSFFPTEYVKFFFQSPFLAFARVPQKKIYVAEADCDRPGEGDFLAKFLQPDYTLWLNATLTHSMNFDFLVREKEFARVEEAIASEFGKLALATQKKLWVDGDDEMIVWFLKKNTLKIPVEKVKLSTSLQDYLPSGAGTKFVFKNKTLKIDQLLPRKAGASVLMTEQIVQELGGNFDQNFSRLKLEPGRSGLFAGVKKTVLLDSTYNASWDGMQEMLDLLAKFPGQKKWAVLGDMLEQGEETVWAHAQLAEKLLTMKLEKIVLVGPRLREFTYPLLTKKYGEKVKSVLYPREIAADLRASVTGGEVILFKGARFLDGLVEELLVDKSLAQTLVRREAHWQKKRAKFY